MQLWQHGSEAPAGLKLRDTLFVLLSFFKILYTK
jgi:hypothetical protein